MRERASVSSPASRPSVEPRIAGEARGRALAREGSAIGNGRIIRAGGGHRVWFLGNLMTIKQGLRDVDSSTLIEGDLGAGHAPPLHLHHHDTESFYVLSGSVRFRVGEDLFEAEPGDCVLVPSGLAHAFRIGENGARMLMMSSSPLLARFMTAGGEPAVGSSAPLVSRAAFDRVIQLAAAFDMTVVGPPLG